jgi:hypothetical protein
MKSSKSKIEIKWSPDFAYAIGLIVTDGCLSSDGRHILFSSKDMEQVDTLLRTLKIRRSIKMKSSGFSKEKKYFFVQIGDVGFYRFLLSIGLMPNKSKIIGTVDIPNLFFSDFLRGHLDGDGCFYSYFDPRWKSSFMYYTVFNSASSKHVIWLQQKIQKLYGLKGHITKTKKHSCISLKYAKKESGILLSKIYYNDQISCLNRKRLKIFNTLSIIHSR